MELVPSQSPVCLCLKPTSQGIMLQHAGDFIAVHWYTSLRGGALLGEKLLLLLQGCPLSAQMEGIRPPQPVNPPFASEIFPASPGTRARLCVSVPFSDDRQIFCTTSHCICSCTSMYYRFPAYLTSNPIPESQIDKTVCR